MVRSLTLNLAVVWAGFQAEGRSIVTYNVYVFGAIVFPFFYMVLMIFYFDYADRVDFIPFAVIGSGLMGVWLVATFVTSYIVLDERWLGTLEIIVAAPASMLLWIFGRSLSSTSLSLVSLLVCLAGARLFFAVDIAIRGPLLFVLMIITTVIVLSLVGTTVSSLFVLTRSADPVVNLMLYPVYLSSGLVFPVAVLPRWLRPLAGISPLRWASEGLRAAMAGEVAVVERSLFHLMIIGLVLGCLSILCFRTIENRVRRDGTLGQH